MEDSDNNPLDDFNEYLRQSEPHQQRERAESWKTAIGLQAVDGLTTSEYLVETAKRHIEGSITIGDVQHLIDSYYEGKSNRQSDGSDTEEADKVSANITQLLNEKTFTFSPMGYISLHRRIFAGVFPFAGQLREYNITKKEWVLRGDTVLYASAEELLSTLEYDFEQEGQFNYARISSDDMVVHFTKFISMLWQIHPFAEGNTRTTAVFAIKYLRFMGFDVHNEFFADNAWYFRNALVRANYRNYQNSIEPEIKYLERFFRNVLWGESNSLKNRHLLVPSTGQSCQRDSLKQDPDMYQSYTVQVPDKYEAIREADNPRLIMLVQAVGMSCLSVKEMLALLNLRHRESFLKSWLNPALQAGVIRLLYQDTPKHPQQKYLLTKKGLAIYQHDCR